jgi:hypothetical protein
MKFKTYNNITQNVSLEENAFAHCVQPQRSFALTKTSLRCNGSQDSSGSMKLQPVKSSLGVEIFFILLIEDATLSLFLFLFP